MGNRSPKNELNSDYGLENHGLIVNCHPIIKCIVCKYQSAH